MTNHPNRNRGPFPHFFATAEEAVAWAEAEANKEWSRRDPEHHVDIPVERTLRRLLVRAFKISRLIGTRWRHCRRGTEYAVLVSTAEAQCSTSPINEGDHVTVYVDDDGGWYVRKTNEFQDGRFERTEPPEAQERDADTGPTNTGPTNAFHAECPACGAKVDVIPEPANLHGNSRRRGPGIDKRR
jgi:hypothetical protein